MIHTQQDTADSYVTTAPDICYINKEAVQVLLTIIFTAKYMIVRKQI